MNYVNYGIIMPCTPQQQAVRYRIVSSFDLTFFALSGHRKLL